MTKVPFEEIVSFLSDPETHGMTGQVEIVRTHGALVFLTEDEAYKIKRPVTYEYLDFSTMRKRREMLQRELDLNKPGAPGIYRGLVPVTRGEDGKLRLGGDGAAVEWSLHMKRFAKTDELSVIAERGEFTRDIGEDIGRVLADYHARAETRDADGRALVEEIAGELGDAFAGMTNVLDPDAVESFRGRAASEIARTAALLSRRSRAGHVRRGHGDLHLGNLVLVARSPVPFDALEFDERLATLDVLYDLAFVIMDLLHRGLAEPANAALGSYLYHAETPEHLDGLAAMPLFLGLRAGIRAMVNVQAGRLTEEDAAAIYAEARRYLDQGNAYLSPQAPRLVAVGGISGTGKTSVARQLAPGIGPSPGAIHLRSDLERKTLFGVDPLSRLPASAYSGSVGARVYARLLDRADRILKAGHSVVLDAVFLHADERRGVDRLARRNGLDPVGIWLQADEEVLVSRVTQRRGDASDADAAVVQKQIEDAGAPPEWSRIEAGGALSDTVDRALDVIKDRNGAPLRG